MIRRFGPFVRTVPPKCCIVQPGRQMINSPLRIPFSHTVRLAEVTILAALTRQKAARMSAVLSCRCVVECREEREERTSFLALPVTDLPLAFPARSALAGCPSLEEYCYPYRRVNGGKEVAHSLKGLIDALPGVYHISSVEQYPKNGTSFDSTYSEHYSKHSHNILLYCLFGRF